MRFDEYIKQLQKTSERIQRISDPFGRVSGYSEYANKIQAKLDRLYKIPNGILAMHKQ